MNAHTATSQRGITLFMTLIMLVVLTMFVVSAITASTTNMRIVNNIQSQTSSDNATQHAIEQVFAVEGLPILYTPAAQTIQVDSDGNGSTDLAVNVAKPICNYNTVAEGYSATAEGALIAPRDTHWEIRATVDDVANGGTKVVIHDGIKIRLNAIASADCP